MSPLGQFFKHTIHEPELIPLVAILGVALSSAAFMSIHQARAPDVVWNHQRNPEPWQQVRDGDQVKLAAFNQKYDRKYHRTVW